jgi:hypothetical protein
MNNTLFNNRIEKKYQIGIAESEVAGLWRNLCSCLAPYGLSPAQEITSVGSVYFDNRDCDLLRYSLFGHLMLIRLRTYETYGRPPEPRAGYWVEVKTAADERRKKRRFQLPKSALYQLVEGGEPGESIFDFNKNDADRDLVFDLYRDTQETIVTMGLRPLILVLYKRISFQNDLERLSIDWDLQYYYVTKNVLEADSWKYLAVPPQGKSDTIIMEIKHLQGDVPVWFTELQRQYPIRRREYLKTLEGMSFLFQGPLKHHKEANFFLPRIDAYLTNSHLG